MFFLFQCGISTQNNGTSIATIANQPVTTASQESGTSVPITTRDDETMADNQSSKVTDSEMGITTDTVSPPMTIQEDNTSTNCQESEVNLQECDTTIITALGAVIGVLVAVQAATLIVLLCVIKRKQPTRLKPKYTHVIYINSIC